MVFIFTIVLIHYVKTAGLREHIFNWEQLGVCPIVGKVFVKHPEHNFKLGTKKIVSVETCTIVERCSYNIFDTPISNTSASRGLNQRTCTNIAMSGMPCCSCESMSMT